MELLKKVGIGLQSYPLLSSPRHGKNDAQPLEQTKSDPLIQTKLPKKMYPKHGLPSENF